MKYSDSVVKQVFGHLITHAHTVNARGAILILVNGRLWAHKKRDNYRMLKDFSLRAIESLVRERSSMGERFE